MIRRIIDELIFWALIAPWVWILLRLTEPDPVLGPEEEPPYA